MPTETGYAAPSPLTSLLRRWPLALALGLVFAVLGLVVGSLLPSTTTAHARVAVGPGDMSAGAIAGFPEATRSMAEDYARWVTSAGIAQGGDVEVSASPVPESNVIVIEATSQDEGAAVRASQQAADQLVQSVNSGRAETDPQRTLATLQEVARQWSAAKTELERATWEFDQVNQSDTSTDAQYDQAAAQLTQAQAREATLMAQLEAQSERYRQQIANASQSADLRVIQPAHVASDTAGSQRQRYVILGLAVGLLLALVIATMLDRRRSRSVDPVDRVDRAHRQV